FIEMNFTSFIQSLFDYSINSLQKLKYSINGSNSEVVDLNSNSLISPNSTLGEYFRQTLIKLPIRNDLINIRLLNDANFQQNDEEMASVLNKNLKLPRKADIYLENYSRSLSSLVRSDQYMFIKLFCLSFFTILILSFFVLLFLIRQRNKKNNGTIRINSSSSSQCLAKDQKY
ncbi:unnamed protein product, partial [Brachionus calyciflorus]